jgi:hypothetical protein
MISPAGMLKLACRHSQLMDIDVALTANGQAVDLRELDVPRYEEGNGLRYAHPVGTRMISIASTGGQRDRLAGCDGLCVRGRLPFDGQER